MSSARRGSRPFRAILCDLFETIVTFDRAELPRMRIGDANVPTTVPHLLEILGERWDPPHPERILRVLLEVSNEIQAEREEDLRERPSRMRFERALERLGAPEELVRDEAFVGRLVERHMDILDRCTILPPSHGEALERLAGTHRLALVSNFDHAPTCLRILDRLDIARFFEDIVVSDAIGRVKPHRDLFEGPLMRMGLEPSEALFVGDTPDADVLGAKQAGLDVVWINPKGAPLPPEIPAPDFQIASFAELPALLG